jgi:hypothetical protein
MRSVAIIAIIAGAAFLCSTSLAKGEKYEVLNEQDVYYGNASSFANPATVAVGEIFPHIRAYKLIDERKLDESNPEYWVLLKQANEVFRAAVKQVAASGDYDLVAQRGAVKAVATDVAIPDITHLVVAEVKRNSEGRR